MQRYIEHAMLASSIVFLVILNGEATIKMARHGIDEPPGARVAWVASALAGATNADAAREPGPEGPATLRYAGDERRGHEFWRDFYRARWAMAPHRLLKPASGDEGEHSMVLLDLGSEAELLDRVRAEGLHTIVHRGGVGLARPTDPVTGE